MKNIVIASIIGITAMALAAQPSGKTATTKPTSQTTSNPTTQTSQPTSKYAMLDLKNLRQGQIGELPEGGVITGVGTKKGNMGISINYPDGTIFNIFEKDKPEQEFKVGDKCMISGAWRLGKPVSLNKKIVWFIYPVK